MMGRLEVGPGNTNRALDARRIDLCSLAGTMLAALRLENLPVPTNNPKAFAPGFVSFHRLKVRTPTVCAR